ncbi:MAG: metal-dependent transcriptional regulator [Bacteroidetes bacterium]|nr:metal-dependent transcriptional regulator [Bacteroidota bacterium]
MPQYLLIVLLSLALASAALLWPRIGILERLRTARVLSERALLEDYLKHIHARELQGNLATVESLAGSFHQRMSSVVEQLAELEKRGLVQITGGGAILTRQGSKLALQVIRAHRLLERYLFDELRVPLGSLHEEADRREHTMSRAEVDALEARLGFPIRDPHGDPIPTGTGSIEREESHALIDWEIGKPAMIVHLEDEPAAIFSQVVKSGLVTGMSIEILEADDGSLVLWDGEREYELTHVAAANVFVRELAHPVRPPLLLTSLRSGEKGRVVGLNNEGLSRRRLLDLGLTPGTEVLYEFDAALGSPRAYRIRGALVALRSEETDRIEIERIVTPQPSDSP